MEEEGKGSEDRPFSRTPERLPHKRKVAQKEKSPADLAAGGDIKNGKAELSSLKSKNLLKRRDRLNFAAGNLAWGLERPSKGKNFRLPC